MLCEISCYYLIRGCIIFDIDWMCLCIVSASDFMNFFLLSSSPAAAQAILAHFMWSSWRICKGLGATTPASSETAISNFPSSPRSNISWKKRASMAASTRLHSAGMLEVVEKLVVQIHNMELGSALPACWFSESCRSRKALWRAIKLSLNKLICWLIASSVSDLAVSNGGCFLRNSSMLSNSPLCSVEYGIIFAIS